MYREEFVGKAFLFYHKYPVDFSLCAWQKSEDIHPAWLAYRIFLFLYFFSSFIYFASEAGDDSIPNNVSAYHALGFLFMVLTNFFAFLLCALDFAKQKKGKEMKMGCLKVTLWIFYTVAMTLIIADGFMFWLEIYDINWDFKNFEVLIFVNCFIAVLDFYLVAIPFRFYHFWLTLIVFIIEISVSAAVSNTSKSENNDYSVFSLDVGDERKCMAAFAVLLVFFFYFGTHVTFSSIYLIKKYIRNKRLDRSSE